MNGTRVLNRRIVTLALIGGATLFLVGFGYGYTAPWNEGFEPDWRVTLPD